MNKYNRNKVKSVKLIQIGNNFNLFEWIKFLELIVFI